MRHNDDTRGADMLTKLEHLAPVKEVKAKTEALKNRGTLSESPGERAIKKIKEDFARKVSACA